jgi:hypothetical protein
VSRTCKDVPYQPKPTTSSTAVIAMATHVIASDSLDDARSSVERNW